MTSPTPSGLGLLLTWAFGLLVSTLLLGCPAAEIPPDEPVIDDDGDGYSPAADGFNSDCNDANASIHPHAPEACNGIDDDCDGRLEEGWVDGDGDGFAACVDCDDGDFTIHPAAVEICDDADINAPTDENCDGDPWPEGTSFWWIDADHDGSGDALGQAVPNCHGGPPGGHVSNQDDCDDQDNTVRPGGEELCNHVDDDCDRQVDEDFDEDDDGFATCGDDGLAGSADDDCDDEDGGRNPQAVEACDGIDNNCDGLLDLDDPHHAELDADGDGVVAEACGGSDCDDSDEDRFPGAGEACDGIDNDCDGEVDEAVELSPDWDGDGYPAAGCGLPEGDLLDCDDTDFSVHPVEQRTSGILLDCLPLARPGLQGSWTEGTLVQPDVVSDPVSGMVYLYVRAHADRGEQSIGVFWSRDGGQTFQGPKRVLSANPSFDAFDSWNLSDPSVAYVPGLPRPWLMLYHGQSQVDGTRRIGLASAISPLGPFDRLDPNTGDDVLDQAVIEPSGWAQFADGDRTLHPSLLWDADGQQLRVWFSARRTEPETGEFGDLAVFSATSSDHGLTWNRDDEDGVPGPDVWLAPEYDWDGDGLREVSVVEDPTHPGALHVFVKAGSDRAAYAVGGLEGWTRPMATPLMAPSDDCLFMSGHSTVGMTGWFSGQGDVFHAVWSAQRKASLDVCPELALHDPQADDAVVGALGRGHNLIPSISLFDVVEPSTTTTFQGEVSDSSPTGLTIAGYSHRDGSLGTVIPDEPTSDGPGRQWSGWSLTAEDMRAGLHEVTFVVTDEAGFQSTVEATVVVR